MERQWTTSSDSHPYLTREVLNVQFRSHAYEPIQVDTLFCTRYLVQNVILPRTGSLGCRRSELAGDVGTAAPTSNARAYSQRPSGDREELLYLARYWYRSSYTCIVHVLSLGSRTKPRTGSFEFLVNSRINGGADVLHWTYKYTVSLGSNESGGAGNVSGTASWSTYL